MFAAGDGTVMRAEGRERAQPARPPRPRRRARRLAPFGCSRSSQDFVTLVGAEPAGRRHRQAGAGPVRRPACTRRAARLPRRWNVAEPWVTLKKNPAGRVHVLGWVDEKTYTPGEKLAMGVEHPVSWCRELGTGRAFTTTLGLTKRDLERARSSAATCAGAIAYAAGTRSRRLRRDRLVELEAHRHRRGHHRRHAARRRPRRPRLLPRAHASRS